MAENQSTAAPQKGTRAAVQSTKGARGRDITKGTATTRRSFANVEDVHDFVDQYLDECSTAPEAALIVLDERQELKAVEVVPTVPFLLREEGRWENMYRREQQRYLQDLRKRALLHDAAAIVLAVRVVPARHLDDGGRHLDDDADLRETLELFADELVEILRGERVELLDVVTWQRVAKGWRYAERDIQSLHWLDWRAQGDPRRKNKDESEYLRILMSNRR